MSSSVTAVTVMIKLSLNINEKRTGTNSEQVTLKIVVKLRWSERPYWPLLLYKYLDIVISKFFFHQWKPGKWVFGCSDASSWLESDLDSSSLEKFANCSHHHKANYKYILEPFYIAVSLFRLKLTWKCSIDGLFTSRCFYKVRSSLHANHTGLVDIFHCA